MPQPLKIAVYLPSLSGGGAEKLHINLAPEFMKRDMDVTFLLDRAEGPLLAMVPEGAKVVGLNSRRVLQSLPLVTDYLKREKPDIVLANLGHNNIIAIWAKIMANSAAKVVVTQHNMLSEECKLGRKYRVLPLLYRFFLPFADAAVGVSQGISDDLAKRAGNRHKIHTIYNGVVTADFDERANAPVEHPFFAGGDPVFVAAGRMVEQKDFPVLLRAFAHVAQQRPARLIILGDGPLRTSLEALAVELGIAGWVSMPGYQANPLPYMKRADVMVLSSKFEGFAIVLAEALACGTPVVSTDCPYGPAEILRDGTYGRLVPVGDAQALAGAMLQTLDDHPAKEVLRERGNHFSTAACADAYVELFEKLS